ncbi:MAG: GNAT family N-acetyltransferase, partial [Puniceicoccaceae bacterium]
MNASRGEAEDRPDVPSSDAKPTHHPAQGRPNFTATFALRPYQEEDESSVVGVWHRSGRATYSFLLAWGTLTPAMAASVFREQIRPRCQLWVGTRQQRVVAFLALNGSTIDRLYVDPTEWRKGWGRQLLQHAKHLCPAGLELHTHQQNTGARRFYEKHGFRAVRFG